MKYSAVWCASRAGHGTGRFRETHGGTSATRASLAAIRDEPDAFQGARQGANPGLIPIDGGHRRRQP